uniref:protein disulfide-isomerase n=1 Tax=Cuerna arida TaxID=1464854 RepID=A0A1B6EVY3_9HEMI
MLFKTGLVFFLITVCLKSIQISGCVVEYTDDDFEQKIKENIDDKKVTLVKFYAEWCGHCKKLKPILDEACDKLKSEPKVVIAKVECPTTGKDTCERYSVRGYPTLKVFKNDIDKPEEYNAPRTKDSIVKYMQKMVLDDIVEIKSKDDFDKVIDSSFESIVLGVFESDSKLEKVFTEIASEFRLKYTFLISKTDFVQHMFPDAKDDIFIIHPKHLHLKFEDNFVKHDPNKFKSIKSFIEEKIHPKIAHRHSDNSNDFKEPLIVAYYDVDYVRNPKGTNYYRNRIYLALRDYDASGAKVNYNVAISSREDFPHELADYDLNLNEIKANPVFVVRPKRGAKYVLKDYSKDSLKDALKQFLIDIDNGKVEPFIKSEPVPENQDSLKVAVAKNFDEMIFNSGKDSFIKFYAPWCGHCKKLEPVMKNLAEKFADEDVNIVKFDATSNEVDPRFEVRGYPTLYWVSKNGIIKPYEGGRELNDFIKFIAKEASVELKNFDRKGNEKKVEL